MNSYRYILFDLDGTLTNSEEGITKAAAFALSKFGITVPHLSDLRSFIGPPLVESFMEFYGLSLDDAWQAVSYYREYYSVQGIFENQVYYGVPQMLAALQQSGKINILATSKPIIYATQILEHFGLTPYFSAAYGCELDGTRKHKQEVIAYALQQSHIPVQQAIMVGDRKHDVEGAKMNGLDCIGVLYGFGSRQELEQAGALQIVGSAAEVAALLI